MTEVLQTEYFDLLVPWIESIDTDNLTISLYLPPEFQWDGATMSKFLNGWKVYLDWRDRPYVRSYGLQDKVLVGQRITGRIIDPTVFDYLLNKMVNK
jgi:hypothetical protein